MSQYLIKNVTIVNEQSSFLGSVYLRDGFIEDILPFGSPTLLYEQSARVIDGTGKHLFPGIIDDQVHFREPGLEHKGDIFSESRAAVLGGITSYMEMPNTIPPTTTNTLLQDKLARAHNNSWANYSFYLGATNNNLKEILNMDTRSCCGIKVFMGSSTGNMLVDNNKALNEIFSQAPSLVAVHCEDEETINKNMQRAKEKWGHNIPFAMHPQIRSAAACIKSSDKAKELAIKHNTRLHLLHLSTAQETLSLEKNSTPEGKQITAEVCVHHLWFAQQDYAHKGSLIKWNPAIKGEQDRQGLLEAVLDDRIDVIATDHAPHSLAEKQNPYTKAPSGGPLVQHAFLMMLEMHHQGVIPLKTIVQKMAHNPAKLFRIQRRGYIKKGYWGDLVMADLNQKTTVTKKSLQYKCRWSPLEGTTFHSAITHTFINGKLVAENGKVTDAPSGMPLAFSQ